MRGAEERWSCQDQSRCEGPRQAVAPVGQPVSPLGGAACEQGARTRGSALEGLFL